VLLHFALVLPTLRRKPRALSILNFINASAREGSRAYIDDEIPAHSAAVAKDVAHDHDVVAQHGHHDRRQVAVVAGVRVLPRCKQQLHDGGVAVPRGCKKRRCADGGQVESVPAAEPTLHLATLGLRPRPDELRDTETTIEFSKWLKLDRR
jgi:hypothetical protein